jgi:hypothetical protein
MPQREEKAKKTVADQKARKSPENMHETDFLLVAKEATAPIN